MVRAGSRVIVLDAEHEPLSMRACGIFVYHAKNARCLFQGVCLWTLSDLEWTLDRGGDMYGHVKKSGPGDPGLQWLGSGSRGAPRDSSDATCSSILPTLRIENPSAPKDMEDPGLG